MVQNGALISSVAWDSDMLYIGDVTGFVTTFPKSGLGPFSGKAISNQAVQRSDSEPVMDVMDDDTSKEKKKNIFIQDEADESKIFVFNPKFHVTNAFMSLRNRFARQPCFLDIAKI